MLYQPINPLAMTLDNARGVRVGMMALVALGIVVGVRITGRGKIFTAMRRSPVEMPVTK